MRIQLQFLAVLIGVHALVALLFFQVEGLRILKEGENAKREHLEIMEAWSALPSFFESKTAPEFAGATTIEPSARPDSGYVLSKSGQTQLWVWDDDREEYAVWTMEPSTQTKVRSLMRSDFNFFPAENPPASIPSRKLEVLPGIPGKEQVSIYFPEEVSMDTFKSLGLANVKLLGLILALSALLLSILVYFWFVRPLDKIILAVGEQNPDKLAQIANRSSEIGILARLIQKSFRQKAELEQENSLRAAAETSLRLREKQLAQMAEERDRLYRDLHDEIIQSLFALGLHLESHYGSGNAEEITLCRNSINQIIQKIRGYLEESSEPLSRGFPLKSTLEHLVNNLNQIGSCGIILSLHPDFHEGIPNRQGGEITALVTEALSNAIRHARASRITVSLNRENPKWAVLEVVDDGQGCQLESIVRGEGIHNMEERAEIIGASLDLESRPGCGFRITLKFPCSA